MSEELESPMGTLLNHATQIPYGQNGAELSRKYWEHREEDLRHMAVSGASSAVGCLTVCLCILRVCSPIIGA